MNNNEINLQNKKEEEIIKSYNEIANNVKIQKIIWQETKNIVSAEKIYDFYNTKKKTLSKDNNYER